MLLGQCFYYRGLTFKDGVERHSDFETTTESTEQSVLLPSNAVNQDIASNASQDSSAILRNSTTSVDSIHLSPAIPLHKTRHDTDVIAARNLAKPRSVVQRLFFNLTAILVVCAAGVLGWYISERTSHSHHGHGHDPEVKPHATPPYNILGQVFGYLCAAFYLGSRIPQLLLNFRRKSTDGISMLFFIFACIGNLMYVLSILAYEPSCQQPDRCAEGEVGRMYGEYVAINFSWLLGSFGTLVLDMGVFVQYFQYREVEGDDAPVDI